MPFDNFQRHNNLCRTLLLFHRSRDYLTGRNNIDIIPFNRIIFNFLIWPLLFGIYGWTWIRKWYKPLAYPKWPTSHPIPCSWIINLRKKLIKYKSNCWNFNNGYTYQKMYCDKSCKNLILLFSQYYDRPR